MPFRRKRPDDISHTGNAPHPNDAIIPIVTVDNQMLADMVKGILEMHHISCMARALGLGIVWTGPALQAHEILVLERDKARAEEILRAFSDDEDVKLLWR